MRNARDPEQIAYFRQVFITGLAMNDQAGDDEEERRRLESAVSDQPAFLVNDDSFNAVLLAATQLIGWLVDRAAHGAEVNPSEIIRELALWSAQADDEGSSGS